MPTPRSRRAPRVRSDLLLPLVVATLAAASCADAPGAKRSAPAAPAARSAPPGDASFPSAAERARLTFEPVRVASSAPEANFTNITGFDVGSHGEVYVGDWQAKQVTVLSPEGRVLRTVGRTGAGPGEFGSIADVEVRPGDSLQVYDLQLSRLTVFRPGTDEVAYTRNMVAPGETTVPYRVQRTRDPERMMATFRRAFGSYDDPARDEQRTEVLKLIAPDGSLHRDSVLVFSAPKNLVLRSGDRVAVNSDPFGRMGIAKLGSDDRIYYAWTDSARVRILSLEGDSVGGFTVPHEAPPVTGADLARVADKLRAGFRRALEDAAPKRWPAIRGMEVDDHGRVWVGLAAAYGEPAEWAVFSGEGRYLASARLPAGATVSAVRGDRIYAVVTDELDVPSVVIYRFDGISAGAVALR